MLDYDSDIISGNKIGIFQIRHNINDYLLDLYAFDVKVQMKIYGSKNRNKFHSYLLDGRFRINTLSDGEIINISCLKDYKGLLKGKLGAGMSINEIINNTSRQDIVNGSMFLDKDYVFFYALPSPYDEIADNINHLPDNLILHEITVGNFRWWFYPQLTPDYAK